LSENRGRHETAVAIEIHYRDEETACAVCEAISPDNLQAPRGTIIKAETAGGVLRVSIACSRGLGSLIATVDDLLSCVQSAEKAIEGLLG